jgi:hypothetical protein
MAQRLPQLVHEITAADTVKIGNREKPVVDDHIFDDHIGFAVPLLRPELRQPFHEPQRRTPVANSLSPAQVGFQFGHSKYMNQFVPDDMLKIIERTVKRHHHPPLDKLRKPAHRFGKETRNNIGLGKISR